MIVVSSDVRLNFLLSNLVCEATIDMVFMLDQSGSVGEYNHGRALDFIHDVVTFYNISHNATQVSMYVHVYTLT